MNRRLVTILTGAVLASCLAAAPAGAGIIIQINPPAFFIATTRPVYFQGHANYWYRNSWRYREGHTWRTYRTEPQYLREYRGRHQPERHYYGHRHDRHDRHDHHGERR
jgi:hypothetical protein